MNSPSTPNCITLLFFICLIAGCTNHRLKDDRFHLAVESKLARIRALLKETQPVNFPFKGSYIVKTDSVVRLNFASGTDTLFRKDIGRLGHVHVAGYLPDTTNYYGFFLVGVIAIENWYLVTFDKSGGLIDSQKLTEENCLILVGDVRLCEEYFIANLDGTIEYHYESIVDYEHRSPDSITTVYETGFASGILMKEGKVSLDNIIKKDSSVVRRVAVR